MSWATIGMQSLLEIVLSNSAIATLLAVIAAVAGRYCRRPSIVYGLWLLVLVKLVTPPLVRIPVSFISELTIDEPRAASALEPPLEHGTRFDAVANRSESP